MSEKSKLQLSELKHYIRPNNRASVQEIVTEKVSEGSASFKFIERMESRRKKQECVRTIDMRGRTPYECKSYIHRNRVFWMDDISYSIFLKGLEKNNNVFTNEIFEEIHNGKHTNSGIRKELGQSARKEPGAVTDITENKADEYSLDKFLIEGSEPEIVYLGYYQRRTEERIKHATDIVLSINQKQYQVKSRDISPHGIQVSTTQPFTVEKGDEVLLSFTSFNSAYNMSLTRVPYKVLGTEYMEPEFRLRLLICNTDDKAVEFLDNFIQEQKQTIKGRKKLDLEDIRLTAESQIIELYYTNSTATIPFFISRNGVELLFHTMCTNKNNKSILDVFRDRYDRFDFSCLTDESRIQKLYEISQDDGQNDPVVAVYKDNEGTPRAVFDFEIPDVKLWKGFLISKLDTRDLKIFKVLLRSITHPDKRKISQKLDKLREKSEDTVDEILQYIQSISKAGVLVDITQEISTGLRQDYSIDRATITKGVEAASTQYMKSGKDAESLQFGYTEQRHEDRYHVSVEAEVVTSGGKYNGTTRDISIKGLCIHLDVPNAEGLRKGDLLSINLPGLHRRAKERIKLVEIPYILTCVSIEDGRPLLHLKREKTSYWNEQSEFFKDLIDRNIHLIKLDTKDRLTAAKSRLIGSIAAESPATLPILVFRDRQSGDKLVNVAFPAQPCSFVDFFEVEPGIFNFKPITETRRMANLLNNIKTPEQAMITIYMFKKQIPGIAKYEIYSAVDSEFEGANHRKEFFKECLLNDYCFIRLNLTQVMQPKDVEITNATEILHEISPLQEQKLMQKYSQLAAIGDIIDITKQVSELESEFLVENVES